MDVDNRSILDNVDCWNDLRITISIMDPLSGTNRDVIT